MAARPTVMATTASASHTRSWVMRTWPTVHVPLGRIGLTGTPVVPTRTVNTAVNSTITPIDATALATDGAARNSPTAAQTATEMIAAGQNSSLTPRLIVFGKKGRGSAADPG